MNVFRQIWVVREVIIPALDVLLLSYLIYKSYQILVQTRAVQLVRGALLLALLYAVAFFFNLETLLWIINILAPSFVIGLAIIFQPELRKIFTRIGQGPWLQGAQGARPPVIEAVLSAAEVLAYRKRGALVVFVRNVGQKNILETGTVLDAEVTAAMLLTIFGYDTPLHDGAVLIDAGRAVSAGCFLPLSEQIDVRRSFGTRHRAALGLAEESDAVVLVVSEESGAISLAYDANLYYDLSIDEVRLRLNELLFRGGRSFVGETQEVTELAD